MLGQIQRMRPTYSMDELLLHQETGELSYAPDEFVPHTVTVNLRTPNSMDLVFEYSIDELPGSVHSLDLGVSILLSKFTFKVLKISVMFGSAPELLSRLTLVESWLDARKYLLLKDSYKKNYQLAMSIVRQFYSTVESRPEILHEP